MFDIFYAIDIFPIIATGVKYSLSIVIVGFVGGSILGFFLSLAKIYKIFFVSRFVDIYVSFFRGTPLLVQIFLCYYGVPLFFRYLNEHFGVLIDISFIPAIYFMYLCFVLYGAAYLCEIFRSAILSIDKGQMEASYSVGMSTAQALRRIILPQALLVALPNLSNFIILLLKDTSLAFAASVPEIMGMASIEASRSSKFLEVYIVAAIIYWVICSVLAKILSIIEARFMKNKKLIGG